MKKSIGILSLGLWLLTSLLPAQTVQEAAIARMRARLAEESQYGEFSGVVVVGYKGEILLEEAFGYADVEQQDRLNPSSHFMIASVSKSFTAAAILKLEQEGKLSVYDHIGKYLPEYPGWAGEVITIHQLLTHTSGIPDYINDFPLRFRIKRALNWHPSKDRLISSFKNKELNFDPGTSYEYSNSGYVLLARIVENVTGMEFNQYLRRHILDPLELYHTGTGPYDRVTEERVVPYGGRREMPRALKNFRTEYIFGMGGLYSTAGDLHRWVMALSDTSVLHKVQRDRMFTPFKEGYGYGWEISEESGKLIYSHGGYFPGWNSWVEYYPNDSLDIIILSNRDHALPFWLARDLGSVWMVNTEPEPQAGGRAEAIGVEGRYVKTNMGDEVSRYGLTEIMVAVQEQGVLKLKSSNGDAWTLENVGNNLWKETSNLFTIEFEEYNGLFTLTATDGDHSWYWNRVGK